MFFRAPRGTTPYIGGAPGRGSSRGAGGSFFPSLTASRSGRRYGERGRHLAAQLLRAPGRAASALPRHAPARLSLPMGRGGPTAPQPRRGHVYPPRKCSPAGEKRGPRPDLAEPPSVARGPSGGLQSLLGFSEACPAAVAWRELFGKERRALAAAAQAALCSPPPEGSPTPLVTSCCRRRAPLTWLVHCREIWITLRFFSLMVAVAEEAEEDSLV